MPDLTTFVELFNELHKGACIRDGIVLPSARLGKRKAGAMRDALAEALQGHKRERLRHAKVAMLIRDERHKRLHFRFRCVDAHMVLTKGYLGQSVSHTGDALGILKATEAVLRRFCTKASWRGGEFDEELYNHLRLILEAISIDSASNEVCSATFRFFHICSAHHCSWIVLRHCGSVEVSSGLTEGQLGH